MPALKLPILPGSDPSICESAEELRVFLCTVNDPYITARIGEEKIARMDGHVLLTEGEKFRTRDGWAQGLRYLHMDPVSGKPLAVLNITRRGKGRALEVVASNAYTDPTARRQGLAAGLLAMAKADFPGLYADSVLSVAGAGLVGYAESPPRPRMRSGP